MVYKLAGLSSIIFIFFFFASTVFFSLQFFVRYFARRHSGEFQLSFWHSLSLLLSNGKHNFVVMKLVRAEILLYTQFTLRSSIFTYVVKQLLVCAPCKSQVHKHCCATSFCFIFKIPDNQGKYYNYRNSQFLNFGFLPASFLSTHWFRY